MILIMENIDLDLVLDLVFHLLQMIDVVEDASIISSRANVRFLNIDLGTGRTKDFSQQDLSIIYEQTHIDHLTSLRVKLLNGNLKNFRTCSLTRNLKKTL